VHRIGRTARAGADGIAIAFCDREERPLLRDIEKLTRQTIPSSEWKARPGAAQPVQDAHPQPHGERRAHGERKPHGGKRPHGHGKPRHPQHAERRSGPHEGQGHGERVKHGEPQRAHKKPHRKGGHKPAPVHAGVVVRDGAGNALPRFLQRRAR
jgi:ATP-dependent RNA helicase RhlE